MRNPGQVFQFLFNTFEMLVLVVLAIKVLTYTIVKKLKQKKDFSVKHCYYFYVGFIACQLLYALLSMHSGCLTRFGFSEVAVNYIKNIFFTGSFAYLLIYLYKVTTIRSSEGLYKKNFVKSQRNASLCTRSLYWHEILLTLIQALMVGLTPYVFIVSTFRVEMFTSVLALIALSGVIFIKATTKDAKPIVYTWIGYLIFTNLIIPLSFIISNLEMFVQYYDNGELYIILLRAPFIVFRTLQLAFLTRIACSNRDLKEII